MICAPAGTLKDAIRRIFGKLGSAQISIVCVGTIRIVATIAQFLPRNKLFTTLVYTAADGDKFSFVSFKVSDDDSRELTPIGGPDARLEISIQALRQGSLKGSFRALYSKEPISFNVPRDQVFPKFTADKNGDFSSGVPGVYEITDAKFGPLILTPPALLYIDVIAGIQRINLQDSQSTSVALYSGMDAASAGNFFAANSGTTDGLGALAQLLHIRGHMISADEIEFYFYNTQNGMMGPARAKRLTPIKTAPSAELR